MTENILIHVQTLHVLRSWLLQRGMQHTCSLPKQESTGRVQAVQTEVRCGLLYATFGEGRWVSRAASASDGTGQVWFVDDIFRLHV